MGRSSVPAWTPRVVAWGLPILVLIVGLLAILRIRPAVDPELRDELAEAMANEPDVVVVGNSITKAGVDPEQLAGELGLKVELLTVPGSEAPAWYAVIKNLVLASDRVPRLIIIANRADGLLAVSARTEQDRMRLDQLMTAHEPVLVKKVLDRDARSVIWSELDRRRVQHRRALLDGARDLAAGLAGLTSEDAVSAHNRVFADDNVDYGLARDAWTPPEDGDNELATDPEASLVVDVADLAKAHGVKVAFAHLPSAPGVPDLVTQDQMHGLVRLMNARGLGYVERPRRPVRAAWFSDPVHFRPVGRAFYTRFLAKRIQKLKLHLPNAPVPEAPVPERPPRVTRTEPPARARPLALTARRGSCVLESTAKPISALFDLPPAEAPVTPGRVKARGLPPAWPVVVRDADGPFDWVDRPFRLRRDCEPGSFSALPTTISVVPRSSPVELAPHPSPTVEDPDEGAVTWILPGTTLTLTATDPWDESKQGPRAFHVLAHTFGAEGQAPEVVLRGVGPIGLTSHGGMWRGVAHGGPADWELTVRSPRRGPLVALHSVTVGLGPRSTPFLGSGRNPRQVTLDVVGRPLGDMRPTWTTAEPPVPGPVDLVWNEDGTGHFEAPEVIDLTDRLTGRCSPLAVLEDGHLLERHNDCDDVRTEPGTMCHVGTEIRFHPRPGQARRATYTLQFDRTSGRACNTALWLLQHDEVRVSASRQEMKRFFAGPVELHLSARRFGPPPSKDDVVAVSLLRGGLTTDEHDIRIELLEHGIVLRLWSTLRPVGDVVTLVLENRSPAQAVLFQKATLVETLPGPGQPSGVPQ